MSKGRERLRFQANDRARLARQMAPSRAAFLVEFPTCWHCGQRPTCCDEIVSGMSDRKKGLQHREAWTALCCQCNEFELNGSAPATILTKLGYKKRHDRRWYKPMKIGVLKGKKRTAYTRSDVAIFNCRRLDGGLR